MEEASIDEAVSFLRCWSDVGPWVLTAIVPEGEGIATSTFDARRVVELKIWIGRWNDRRNLYFHVNPVIRELKKEARREDAKGAGLGK